MTFNIPCRDRPVDIERIIDPVTGASYVRPRRPSKKAKKANAHNNALHNDPYYSLPAQWVPAGAPSPYYHLPAPMAQMDPYYSLPARNVQAETPGAQYGPALPFPQAGPVSGADQNGFQKWLESFPHWQVPREMPEGWRPPSHIDWQRIFEPPMPNQYTPRRSDQIDMHRIFEPPMPNHYTPHRPTHQATPLWTPVQPVYTTPWLNTAGLPNTVPDRIEWDNVQGGKLQWTPHPWIAHPLPHPNMPAQQFWNIPGSASGLHPWRGPGGWTPNYGQDEGWADWITGGHPLPGMDPYWTATRWVAPPLPPVTGTYISPWLIPNPRDSNVPHVLWDAAVEPPYRIRRLTSHGGVADFAGTDFFQTKATFPDIKTLQVHLPYMYSTWGPVVIKKEDGITVADVFNAVADYLQKPITMREWQNIRAHCGWDRCSRIEYSMFRRCWSSAGLFDYMKSQGMKRVDLMEGNTIYWGCYMTYGADGSWFLTMGFLPRIRAS